MSNFTRGAHFIMLFYDITNMESFDNIKEWFREVEENAPKNAEKMLIGRKCDMNDKRVVI